MQCWDFSPDWNGILLRRCLAQKIEWKAGLAPENQTNYFTIPKITQIND
jgi:hypothetical protein